MGQKLGNGRKWVRLWGALGKAEWGRKLTAPQLPLCPLQRRI